MITHPSSITTPYPDAGKSVVSYALGQYSQGMFIVAQSTHGICAIFLGDDADSLIQELDHRLSHAQLVNRTPDSADLIKKVTAFIERPDSTLALPLDIYGTPFQKRVWHALQEIPAGTTATYTDVAERIGSPRAVRAVASACAANLIAVAIPCHRVVRRDGGLSGYRWGTHRKRFLLSVEAT